MARIVQRCFSAREFRALVDEIEVSVADLSRRSDVSMSTLGKWQSGKRTPQVDKLREVVSALATLASARPAYAGVAHEDLVNRFIERVIPIPAEERELADWRAVRGLIQPVLASRVGVSTATLSAVERAAAPLSEELAGRLATELQITPEAVRAAWTLTKQRP